MSGGIEDMAVSMLMDVLVVAVRAEEADEPADLEQQPDLIDEAVGRVYYHDNVSHTVYVLFFLSPFAALIVSGYRN